MKKQQTKYKVTVRFEFIQFGEVDTVAEKFHCVVKITSKWHENKLIEKYDVNKHFNPQLFVENSLFDKFEETIEYNLVQMNKDMKVIVIHFNSNNININVYFS